MAGLRIFFICSLLRGTNSNKFEVDIPQTVQVMTGSCVTVPCSFDIEKKYETNLTSDCKAKWVLRPNLNPQLSEASPITGDLTKKNCTTTFSNLQIRHTNNYMFRIECNNTLKYRFRNRIVQINVTDHFPSPTLTPSTLEVKEGDSVSLTCSAPAPCLPHPPTLTWTPSLGDTQETLMENQDKSLVKTSVLNFTASHLHDGQKISCTAVYKKHNDSSFDSSLTTSLIPQVSFPSRILFSSSCTKTANQINCSCETVGNPSPKTRWLLNGKHVNQSSQVVITNESLSVSRLTSVIVVKEPQERNLSTLLCLSSNSLGSASIQFCVSCLESSRENQGQILMSVFIATITAFIFIVCVLLVFFGFQKFYCTPARTGGNTDTNAHIVKEENEVQNSSKDAMYANSREPGQAENPQLSTGSNIKGTVSLSAYNAKETSLGSGKKNPDVVYSSVNCLKKNKSKYRENYVNTNPSCGSYLEEEECERGDENFVSSALKMGSLYAEVKTINVAGN